ncbi:MAG: NTP transferase domain-containing protein [Deltaproteobacteria bacterium]|nr:NTP transferase domain-containing protein [Deltaproteobacteria bacterium]
MSDWAAMVLAAGFGTRLRPLTLATPKPLIPVANQPLLSLVLRYLDQWAPGRLVVNGHHLADQLDAYLRRCPWRHKLYFSRENEILGTGGGIRAAADWLRGKDFFVTINSDLVTDIDLRPVIAAHMNSRALATLVMHDCPRFNRVLVAGGRVRSFRAAGEGQQLAYTGIQVCSPRLLTCLAAAGDGFVSLIEVYERLLATGEELLAVHVLPPGGYYWRDLGTAADYLAVHRDLAARPSLAARVLGRELSLPLVASTATLDADVVVQGASVIGPECRLGSASQVVDSLLWPGVRLGPGCRVHNSVLGAGVSLPAGRQVDGQVLAAGEEN